MTRAPDAAPAERDPDHDPGRATTAADASGIAGYDPRAFPPVAVTVDVAVLTIVAGALHVVLVERGEAPHAGEWALPGGFVHPDETLDEAAARELAEETGVRTPGHLEQFGAYGDPDRDPRMRVVTVAYLAIVRKVGPLRPGTDAARAELVPVAELADPRHGRTLAFDHQKILDDGIEFAKRKLASTSLATAFVGPEFTMGDLRRVYEVAWGVELDPGNFRRKVLASEGFVQPTGRVAPPTSSGRPSEVYVRATPEPIELHPPLALERHVTPPARAPDAITPPRADSRWSAGTATEPPLAAERSRGLRERVADAVRPPRDRRPAPTAASMSFVTSAIRTTSGGVFAGAAVWRVRAWDDAALQDAMLQRGVIAIGGAEVPRAVTDYEDDELLGTLERAFIDLGDPRSRSTISLFGTYWRSFVDEMQVDDLVLLPLVRRRVAIGRVAGEYAFDDREPEPRLRHTRAVEWLTILPRDALDTELRKRVDAPGTLGRVRLADAVERARAALG